MRAAIMVCFLVVMAGLPAPAQEPRLLNAPNAQALEEVRAGQRAVANAAWWGFNGEDSTESLQAAIDSGARTLIIPYMGDPWIVRPLRLRSDQEIVFEPGVVILAKKGEFQGGGDSLFTGQNVSNLTMRGYGATLRMHKRDYQNPPYKKAEWRMGIALNGCRQVLIEGLRVESTGGDAFYLGVGDNLGWCEDVTIRDCVAYDNHRQGISVISAVNLLVENCVFASTWGTPPEAGIDLEPNNEEDRLVNCVIRNCVFENNNGSEILIYLKPLSRKSEPVSIRFERCLARMTDARLTPPEAGPAGGIRGWAGISVAAIRDDGPQGRIEFVDCVTEDTGKESVRISEKSASSARVRFVNCSFRNPWTAAYPEEGDPRVPIMFRARDPEMTQRPGGVDFEGCYVYDRTSRPTVRFEVEHGDFGLHDVHGEITVSAPGTPWVKLGTDLHDVDLKANSAPK